MISAAHYRSQGEINRQEETKRQRLVSSIYKRLIAGKPYAPTCTAHLAWIGVHPVKQQPRWTPLTEDERRYMNMSRYRIVSDRYGHTTDYGHRAQ